MTLSSSLLQKLNEGLSQQGLHVPQDIQRKLVDFLHLMVEWNAVHNLTAISDPLVGIKRHLLDSLSIVSYLRGHRILDVGTGAGLPGIPLALIEPDRDFVLLDSSQKKIQFVQQAIIQLNIQNIEVVCSRVENYKPPILFDCILSRAYGSLFDFIETSGHLAKSNAVLLAMKGKKESLAQETLPIGYTIESIQEIKVPGLMEERCLVIIHTLQKERTLENKINEGEKSDR